MKSYLNLIMQRRWFALNSFFGIIQIEKQWNRSKSIGDIQLQQLLLPTNFLDVEKLRILLNQIYEIPQSLFLVTESGIIKAETLEKQLKSGIFRFYVMSDISFSVILQDFENSGYSRFDKESNCSFPVTWMALVQIYGFHLKSNYSDPRFERFLVSILPAQLMLSSDTR